MLNKDKINAGTVKEDTESKELTPEELEKVTGGNAETDKAKQGDGTLTPEI